VEGMESNASCPHLLPFQHISACAASVLTPEEHLEIWEVVFFVSSGGHREGMHRSGWI